MLPLIILLLLGVPGVDEVAAGVVRSPEENSTALRVMSFNIRFDNPRDGEHAWPNRRRWVADVVRFHGVELLGVQEALKHQVREIAEDMGAAGWVGVGREDGEDGGEFSAILYRKDRLDLLDSGTFWLSETPDRPGSKGWDAHLPRVVTWARLKGPEGEFVVFNTHFDHAGREARHHSARLLVERAERIAGGLSVLIMGDFNDEPASETYQTLAGVYQDARDISEEPHFGPDGTFGSFEPRKRPAMRIDYIFVSEGVRVLRHATLAHHWDGRHASDHWPLYAEIRIGN